MAEKTLVAHSSPAVVQALVARFEILDVLALFCERIDEYDIDGVVHLFTPDCLTDYGPGRGGEVRGRDALRRRMLQSQGGFRRTHHQLGQVRVELEGNQGFAFSYVTAYHETFEGAVQTARLQYRDLLTSRQGRWEIAKRTAVTYAVSGFAESQWNWVNRQAPSGQPELKSARRRRTHGMGGA
jgi:ketosteroid isomerase-like protein